MHMKASSAILAGICVGEKQSMREREKGREGNGRGEGKSVCGGTETHGDRGKRQRPERGGGKGRRKEVRKR